MKQLIKMNLQKFADKTKISDVIVPEVFNKYVIERTAELSALYQSGIVVKDPELDALAAAGGKLINMPFWQDLSGDDPMRAIGDLVAAYWARRQQVTLLSILKGIYAAAGTKMSGNALDISNLTGNAAAFTGETFLDASYKLGDAEEKLTAIGVHSSVYANLRKQNLIEFSLDSENKPIPTYMGKRVIVDDGMPVDGDVFTSYIFGAGAIGLGNGAAPVPTETDRDSLAGDDILFNRQHFLLHPRGVKFTNNSVSGTSPTNTELSTGTNWERVYENKNVRIVQFKHKLWTPQTTVQGATGE